MLVLSAQSQISPKTTKTQHCRLKPPRHRRRLFASQFAACSLNTRHLLPTRKQKGAIKEGKKGGEEKGKVGGGGTSPLLKQAGLSMGGSAQTHQLLNQGESGAAVKINDLNTANSSQWRSVEDEEEGEGEEEAPKYSKAWREGSGGESRPSEKL